MKTSRFAVFVAALALALAAAPALAHGPGGGGACRQDLATLCSQLSPTPAPGPGNCLKALCPTFTPGPGAFANCVQGLSVSAQCKQQLTNMQTKIATWQSAFNTACATATGTTPSDVSTYCGNVTGGMGSQIQCLRQAVRNNQTVSATCQAFLAKGHGHRQHGHPGHGCNKGTE
jgi:hypothetical protein